MDEDDDFIGSDTQPMARTISARSINKQGHHAQSPSPSAVSSRAPSPISHSTQHQSASPTSLDAIPSLSNLSTTLLCRKKRKSKSGSPSTTLDSPTIQFLKNPFPSPVHVPQSQCSGQEVGQNWSETQLMMKKRARIWFRRRPTTLLPTVAFYNNGRPVSMPSNLNFEKIQHSVISSVAAPSGPPAPPILDPKPSYYYDEEENESDYDDDEAATLRKNERQRAGAALRTTIACTELRNAFVTNPHPASELLDALAIRLGLGKSE